MTTSGQVSSSALEALLADGKLEGNWTLDGAKSEIALKSKSMWGMAAVKGVFSQVSGTGTVSAAGEVTGSVAVGAASIDTKNSKRDDHLRSADFFDVSNHPEITFEVDSIKPAGDGVTVAGTLTVRGRAKTVSFPATVSGGDAEVRIDGDLQVDRSDFGLTWNKMGMTSMKNTIKVGAVFTKE
jgi:polyisoprenoid-binding protein YceI